MKINKAQLVTAPIIILLLTAGYYYWQRPIVEELREKNELEEAFGELALWSSPAQGRIVFLYELVNSKILFGTADLKLSCWDVKKGEQLWESDLKPIFNKEYEVNLEASVNLSRICILDPQSSVVCCIGLSGGDLIWTQRLEDREIYTKDWTNPRIGMHKGVLCLSDWEMGDAVFLDQETGVFGEVLTKTLNGYQVQDGSELVESPESIDLEMSFSAFAQDRFLGDWTKRKIFADADSGRHFFFINGNLIELIPKHPSDAYSEELDGGAYISTRNNNIEISDMKVLAEVKLAGVSGSNWLSSTSNWLAVEHYAAEKSKQEASLFGKSQYPRLLRIYDYKTGKLAAERKLGKKNKSCSFNHSKLATLRDHNEVVFFDLEKQETISPNLAFPKNTKLHKIWMGKELIYLMEEREEKERSFFIIHACSL